MTLLQTLFWIVLAFWGVETIALLVVGLRGRSRAARTES